MDKHSPLPCVGKSISWCCLEHTRYGMEAINNYAALQASHRELVDTLESLHSDCLTCEKGRLKCPYEETLRRAQEVTK